MKQAFILCKTMQSVSGPIRTETSKPASSALSLVLSMSSSKRRAIITQALLARHCAELVEFFSAKSKKLFRLKVTAAGLASQQSNRPSSPKQRLLTINVRDSKEGITCLLIFHSKTRIRLGLMRHLEFGHSVLRLYSMLRNVLEHCCRLDIDLNSGLCSFSE